MYFICISLKGNMSCGGSKKTDVARPPEKIVRLHNKEETPLMNHCLTNRFQELGMGEPSRNVIEMIIRASSANTKRRRRSSSCSKIKRVLKVNNPVDIVARFESYRERVMMISSHPRGVVDGNELLQFYGTTMRCSSSRSRMRVLCGDPGCRVCRIIETGFDTWYNKVHGIRVSSKSQSMSEEEEEGVSSGNRAVIICRTIAGAGGVAGVGDDINMINVRNPTALLPCFVVVFH